MPTDPPRLHVPLLRWSFLDGTFDDATTRSRASYGQHSETTSSTTFTLFTLGIMEHGGMNHGGMDHGGMDHGGMDHGSCSMNMVWNWDTTNVCILTSSWRITTPLSLYVSLSLIMLAGVGYEWLRSYIRRYDARLARSTLGPAHRRRASLRLPTSNTSPSRRSPSTAPASSARWIQPLECSRRTQVVRSGLYAASVGFSFALMLVAMTFNAFVIAAIVAGAGLGNYMFNRDLSASQSLADDKGLACHA